MTLVQSDFCLFRGTSEPEQLRLYYYSTSSYTPTAYPAYPASSSSSSWSVLAAIIFILKECLAKSQNFISSSLQMRKLILISSFLRKFCPPTMSIMPGTMNASPRQAMPGASTSMLKRWQMETVMMGSKQEATLRMKAEKILSTSKLPIIRFSPSIMDTQNTFTKFQRVKSPNTPRLGSKENSLPPKKQPTVMRLTQRQRLQRKRFENRGVLGMEQFSSKKRMATLPRIDTTSPQNLLRGEQPRQKASGFYSTGRLQESHMIMAAPRTTRIDPPISLSQKASRLQNFRSEMKKNLSLSRGKVCDRAVSLSARAPISTHTEQFIEKMKCRCRFYRFSSALNFSAGTLVVRCSQSTKGISISEVMKIRQADRVLLSHRTSTVIQQGTTALLIELKMSSSHATKELNSIGSYIYECSSMMERPLLWRERLTWLLKMMDLSSLCETYTSCFTRQQTEIDARSMIFLVADSFRFSRRLSSSGRSWHWLRADLMAFRWVLRLSGEMGELTLRKRLGGIG